MQASQEFKVSFGRIGRTLLYEDAEGALLFCFEAAPTAEAGKKKWTMYLGVGALSGDGKQLVPVSPRVATARERARDYLVGCGYEVVLESA